jgi:hypothetical protein
MIEILALAGAVTKVASGISAAVQAGSDVQSLMPRFGKLAKLEADINFAESGKHKGFLGRLSSSEEEGFAIAQAKMAHRQAHSELRSVCQIYGPPGLWQMVVAEQAAARKRQRNAHDERAKARDKFFWAVSIGAGVVTFVVGLSLMLWGVVSFAKP